MPRTAVEWRPSRWLLAVLVLLGLLAALSLLASDLRPGLAWPSALLAAACGLWLARRESRMPRRVLVVRDAGETVEIDAAAVDDFRLDWRGPLAFACWRDAGGHRHRLVWWPDTLPPGARRELRLAAPVETPAHSPRSMAP